MKARAATQEDLISLADAGNTIYQITRLLNEAGLTQEDKKAWTNHRVVEWFDRIPNEHLEEHWPAVRENISRWYASLADSRARQMGGSKENKAKATKQSNANRQKKREAKGLIVLDKQEAIVKKAVAKPAAKAKPAESAPAKGALLSIRPDGSVAVHVTDTLAEAVQALLTQDGVHEAMLLADVAGYMAQLGITRITRL